MSSQEVLHKCSTCSRIFENRNKLTSHIYYHHPKELFTCSTCGKQFKVKHCLYRHILIHTGEQPFACSTCNKRFNQKHRLTEHERIHSGEKPYLCPTCAQRFSYRQTFVEHLRDHAGIKHDCPVCQQEFIYLKHLSRHLKSHADEKHFSCLVCTKEFSELSAILNHMKVHSGDKPHECQICHKQFKTINKLQKHINDCLKINEIKLNYQGRDIRRKFKCYNCDIEFPQRDELDEHVKNHLKQRSLNFLKANKERYVGKKCIICDVCEFRCSFKHQMIRHLITHSGERPIKCSICCKAFQTSRAVKKHKARVHGIDNHTKRSYISHEGRHLMIINGKKPSNQSVYNEVSHKKEVRSCKQPSKASTCNESRRQKERPRREQPSKAPLYYEGFSEKVKIIRHEKVKLLVPNKIDLSLQSFSLQGESAVLEKEASLFERDSPSLEKEASPFERESSPLEKETSTFERHSSPLEKEATPFERESSPLEKNASPKIIEISPQRETLESENDLNKYYLSKELKIVLHKLTKDEIKKQTLKNSRNHMKTDQKPHLYEQIRINLSERKSFSVDRESLSSEMQSIPQKRKTLYSEQDRKGFSQKQILKRHQLLHLKDKEGRDNKNLYNVNKVFICDICEKRFGNKFNMARHLNIHSGERPFKCPICFKGFKEKGHAKRHQKQVHFREQKKTSPRPFNCPICFKGYTEKSNVKRHQKQVHFREQNKHTSPLGGELSSLESESFPLAIKTISPKRESSPLASESLPFDIDTVSLERELSLLEGESSSLEREYFPLELTPVSKNDFNKYDLSKDLNVVSHKPKKGETKNHNSKEQKDHIEGHQKVRLLGQERISSSEKMSFSVEQEASTLERLSFSPGIETIHSPERKAEESEKDLNNFDHLINKLRRKDLNIVPLKLTKDSTEKSTSKEDKSHKMTKNETEHTQKRNIKRKQTNHLRELEIISLSERKSSSEERASSPLEIMKSELFERETPRSLVNMNKYVSSKELTLVLNQLRQDEIENNTSKEQKGPERIRLSERKSSPSDFQTISPEYDNLINKLRKKTLNIVPLKPTKDSTARSTSKEYFDETQREKLDNETEEVFSDETKKKKLDSNEAVEVFSDETIRQETVDDSEDDSLYLLFVLICFLCLFKSLKKKRK